MAVMRAAVYSEIGPLRLRVDLMPAFAQDRLLVAAVVLAHRLEVELHRAQSWWGEQRSFAGREREQQLVGLGFRLLR